MSLKKLYNIFSKNKDKNALCLKDKIYTYHDLLNAIQEQKKWLQNNFVTQGQVVALEADYSMKSIATFIALIELKAILVPRTNLPQEKLIESREISEANFIIQFDEQDIPKIKYLKDETKNQLLLKLKSDKKPGLVIFSSGSTGKSKAAVHNLELLMEKFLKPRHSLRVLVFLLFDHIGGFNTLFYTLFNGGCLVVPESRSPLDVAKSIEKYKAEALTTSPTFLNLLLLNGCLEEFDLNSLKYINYSSEVMPEYLLEKLKNIFPSVRFSQAYGLSEVGVLNIKSRSSSCTYFKMDETVETRIVNNMLEIKSNTTMLGYLNADSPFTEDGWFKTGDMVEYDGDYIKILGRNSDMINFGGTKVYPAEVENVIQQMEDVEEVSVSGESHPMTGQMIKVNVVLKTNETNPEFKKRMNLYCLDKLPRYKIPQKVLISKTKLYNERFKKMHVFGGSYGQ